jgi:NAD(P)-dependent dehydrogenase (short-subunit alcohol dehydrogenase family)
VSDKWTADDMPNLSGKVIVVTGANSGVGFEASREFARKGAHTILACRDPVKAQVALTRIREEIPEAQAQILRLDLASLNSVHQFTTAVRAGHDRLDVLVNNAGLGGIPYTTTEDGFEMHMGTNHLGHFALTGLLLDLLLGTRASRVVTVTSAGHVMARMDLDNLNFDGGKDYSMINGYGRSKLANLLFTYELQRRFEARGVGTIAVAVHPGNARTNLMRNVANRWYVKPLLPLIQRTQQSAAMGALPTLRAAVDPQVRGGQYYGPGGWMGMRGCPVVVRSSKTSHNTADARKLWRLSEELTGVTFGALAG